MPDDTTNDDVFAGSPWLDPATGAVGAGTGSADHPADAAAGGTDTGDAPSDGEKSKSEETKFWDKPFNWLEKQTDKLPPKAAKVFSSIFSFRKSHRKGCGCVSIGCGCFIMGPVALFVVIPVLLWLGGYGPGGDKSKMRHPVVVTPSHSVNFAPPTAPGETPISSCPSGETLKSKPGGRGMWCRPRGQFFGPTPTSSP